MKTIVSSEEVIRLAFSVEEHYAPTIITSDDIADVEYEYIIPILGQELYDAICGGKYKMLRDDYVAPAVAASLRASVEPLLVGRFTECRSSKSISAADVATRRQSLMILQRKARNLRRRMSDYIEAHAEEFSEYDSTLNPLNRCSIDGNIVQVY